MEKFKLGYLDLESVTPRLKIEGASDYIFYECSKLPYYPFVTSVLSQNFRISDLSLNCFVFLINLLGHILNKLNFKKSEMFQLFQ